MRYAILVETDWPVTLESLSYLAEGRLEGSPDFPVHVVGVRRDDTGDSTDLPPVEYPKRPIKDNPQA